MRRLLVPCGISGHNALTKRIFSARNGLAVQVVGFIFNLNETYMTYLWLILNALDALLTVFIVRNGGIEVMPVMGWLISQSLLLFVALKIAGGFLVLRILKKYPDALRVLNGAFITIVGINAFSLSVIYFYNLKN